MVKTNLYLVTENSEDMDSWRIWTKEELLDVTNCVEGTAFKIKVEDEYEIIDNRILRMLKKKERK